MVEKGVIEQGLDSVLHKAVEMVKALFVEWWQSYPTRVQQYADFKGGLNLIFATIMIGFLAWFLARAFGKGEVSTLIKVITVCECVRIAAKM